MKYTFQNIVREIWEIFENLITIWSSVPLLRYSTSCLKLVSKPVFIFAWWYSPIQYTKNVAGQKWKASLSLLLICLVLYTKEAWRYMYPKAGQEAHKPILLTWVKNLKGVFFICISDSTYIAFISNSEYPMWLNPVSRD